MNISVSMKEAFTYIQYVYMHISNQVTQEMGPNLTVCVCIFNYFILEALFACLL